MTLRIRILLAALCCGLAAGAQTAKLISERPAARPPALVREWPAVMTHTHNWRFRDGETPGNFEEAEQRLAAWCGRLGIRAVGVGSAWNPAVEANFQRFEGPDRDLYYSGKFDQKSVMDVAGLNRTLQYLNARSDGKTLFYLDNETPKSRMSHVWWFGYLYDNPPWHDYSQDRPIKYWEGDSYVELNSLTHEPHTRRNLFEIMAIQRKAGALGVFAHPTRWWISNGKFVTNIAAMSGLFLLTDGYLDGMAVMGDRVYNKPYQDLWFSFLDTGAKIPGFAETDFALNKAGQHTSLDTFLNHPYLGTRPVNEQNIHDAAKIGQIFSGNGAFLNVTVDGVPMGSVCRTAPGRPQHVRIEAYPEEGGHLGRIEVIGKHGVVLAVKKNFPGGVLEYEVPGGAEASYIVVRAFGAGDDPLQAPDQVKHLAVSNPVYLWPAGFAVHPAVTACTFHVPAGGRWNGGVIEFQKTDGALIQRRVISGPTIAVTLPANARVVLHKPGLKERMFYIAMENAAVENNLSYLIDGKFRNDYPNLHRSQIPPQAFHLPQMREALRTFEYDLK
jgi:hypothetical protein